MPLLQTEVANQSGLPRLSEFTTGLLWPFIDGCVSTAVESELPGSEGDGD